MYMLSKTWQSAALWMVSSYQPSNCAPRDDGWVRGSDEPSTALLNLGDVELEEAVQPLHKLLSIMQNPYQLTLAFNACAGRRYTNRDSPMLTNGW